MGIIIKARYYKPTGVLFAVYAYRAYRPKGGTPTHKYLGKAKLVDEEEGIAEFNGELYPIQGFGKRKREQETKVLK